MILGDSKGFEGIWKESKEFFGIVRNFKLRDQDSKGFWGILRDFKEFYAAFMDSKGF